MSDRDNEMTAKSHPELYRLMGEAFDEYYAGDTTKFDELVGAFSKWQERISST